MKAKIQNPAERWTENWDCEPVPGKTMPAIGLIERDYTKIYDKWIALGTEYRKRHGDEGNFLEVETGL